MDRFDVICFGDLNADYIGTMERLPEADEELPINDLEMFCGGAATNVAVALARLGNKVAYTGSSGADSIGQQLLNELTKEKVDTSKVVTKSNTLTGMVIAILDKEGERRLITYSGANLKTTAEDLDETFIRSTRVLHMSSPYYLMVPYLLSMAKRNNLITSFDPGSLICRFGPDEIKPILHQVDILFLNRIEYQQITGNTNKIDLELFLNLGCKIVIYKEGKKGSYVKTKNGIDFFAEGFPVKTVDTTGAGDAFAAGFLHAYLKGMDLKETMKYANAVGALSVTKKGAKEALPTNQELMDFLYNK